MIPILDNGHGGMINGVYQTSGKRSPRWSKGVLFEGMFNRWIVNGVIKELDYLNKPYYHVSPELLDVSLVKRVERANSIFSKNKKGYFLSIHANAGGGTGWEVYTSKGETKSDRIADKFISNFEGVLPIAGRYDETDGDKDKEENFYVLKNTACPAVLLELGFMDHKNDYDLLWNRAYQKMVIDRVVKTIKELY